jgi:hypothetical protein
MERTGPDVAAPLGDWSMLFYGPWLSYAAPELGEAFTSKPAMSLSQFYKQPLYGWVDWTLGVGADETTIQPSRDISRKRANLA